MKVAYMVIDGDTLVVVYGKNVFSIPKAGVHSPPYSKIIKKVFETCTVKSTTLGKNMSMDDLAKFLEGTTKVWTPAPTDVTTSGSIGYEIPEDTTLFRSAQGVFVVDDIPINKGDDDERLTLKPGDVIDTDKYDSLCVQRAIAAKILVPTTLEEALSIKAQNEQRMAGIEARDIRGGGGLAVGSIDEVTNLQDNRDVIEISGIEEENFEPEHTRMANLVGREDK